MTAVTTEAEFRSAISAMESEILIENDITLTARTIIGYTVVIRGNAGVSLFWGNPSASNRDMFYVTGELTIESLILDAEYRDGTLVQVSGGTFIMNDGAILRNIRSTTAQNAVDIGDMMSTVGGSFIMNGGLITGVESGDSAVFCSGGSMEMHNDAEISGNINSGITLVDTYPDGIRAKLTMTGNSRISDNECRLSGGYGGAGRILGSDVIMGISEGDAPVVRGNKSVGVCGGFYLTRGIDDTVVSTLTMRYGSEISDNYAAGNAGGVGGWSSSITMSENATIKDNRSDAGAGGLMILANCEATLSGNARILGNSAKDAGGGVFIARDGGLHLTEGAIISENSAELGGGVYKEGVLTVSQSAGILDGLYFDDLQAGVVSVSEPMAPERTYISGDVRAEGMRIRLQGSGRGVPIRTSGTVVSAAGEPLYSDNVPIIADNLTDTAIIQLELSDYLSPSSVPLVIAEKDASCALLGETDRAAWRLPVEFAAGHIVTLRDTLAQVLIELEVYGINYDNLYGVENPNPVSYDISDLPISLSDPGQRPGFAFTGWYDADGTRVTEIPVGVTGDMSLRAGWEKLFLLFDGNAPCVCGVPKKLPAGEDGKVTIPLAAPCRERYGFICWNIPDSGSGRVYFPGDTILLSGANTTLYAQWQPDCRCCCHERIRGSIGAGGFTGRDTPWRFGC